MKSSSRNKALWFLAGVVLAGAGFVLAPLLHQIDHDASTHAHGPTHSPDGHSESPRESGSEAPLPYGDHGDGSAAHFAAYVLHTPAARPVRVMDPAPVAAVEHAEEPFISPAPGPSAPRGPPIDGLD